MKRQCLVCKKEFEPPIHNVINGYGIYCSRSCAAKIKVGEKNPNWHGGIVKECIVCGSKFTPKNREKNRVNKYCSHECRGKDKIGDNNSNWKNGTRSGRKGYERDLDMGTKNYQAWKNAIKERDNHTCQLCNKTGRIIAHHIYSYNTYPQLRYAINNGITLCQSCHSSISFHEEDFINFFLALINPSETERETSEMHNTDEDIVRSAAKVAEVSRNDLPISKDI